MRARSSETVMRILLAPMEGVIDHNMRALLTALGGIDRCVTEFVRVTDQLLPKRVFYRLCPELQSGSRTPSGVPVYVQLLGGKVGPMAENGLRAASLGAAGVDLNFGCPAKLVNRNDGGAVLLREPERIHAIIAAVRTAVPAAVPVTAKVRLGFDDDSMFTEVAHAVAAAGADELVVHARTRRDGYHPPAFWHRIADVKATLPIPVIANGEIWSPVDCRQCQAIAGCDDVMIGRGVLAWPELPRLIKADQAGLPSSASGWSTIVRLLLARLEKDIAALAPRHAPNPTKQWLHYLQRQYIEATLLFEKLKRVTDPEQCRQLLSHEITAAAGRGTWSVA